MEHSVVEACFTNKIGFEGTTPQETQINDAAFDETTCLLKEIDGIMGEFLRLFFLNNKCSLKICPQKSVIFIWI